MLRSGTEADRLVARDRLAHHFEKRGLIDEAAELLANNVAASPDDPTRYIALLSLLWRYDREGQARAATADLQALLAEYVSERVYVRYSWVASLVFFTTWGTSKAYRTGTSAARWAQVAYSLTTLVVGWWGIPWGPIRSIQALASNMSGGEDVTGLILTSAYGTRRPQALWNCMRCKKPMPNIIKRCLACGQSLN